MAEITEARIAERAIESRGGGRPEVTPEAAEGFARRFTTMRADGTIQRVVVQGGVEWRSSSRLASASAEKIESPSPTSVGESGDARANEATSRDANPLASSSNAEFGRHRAMLMAAAKASDAGREVARSEPTRSRDVASVETLADTLASPPSSPTKADAIPMDGPLEFRPVDASAGVRAPSSGETAGRITAPLSVVDASASSDGERSASPDLARTGDSRVLELARGAMARLEADAAAGPWRHRLFPETAFVVEKFEREIHLCIRTSSADERRWLERNRRALSEAINARSVRPVVLRVGDDE